MENYDIRYDDKYGHLSHIDLAAEGAAHDPWLNQTLTTVNDCAIRLAVIEGRFDRKIDALQQELHGEGIAESMGMAALDTCHLKDDPKRPVPGATHRFFRGFAGLEVERAVTWNF